MSRWARDAAILTLYLLPAVLLRMLGWTLMRITNPHRIGHLAAEPDFVLRERDLGLFPRRKILLLAPRGKVANEHLVDYWAGHVATVRWPPLCHLLAPLNRFRFLRARPDLAAYIAAINTTAAGMSVGKAWGDRAPVLQLTAEDRARGEERLRALGIPPGARIVCFHNREGGYSPGDEHLHDYRNAAVDNYLVAARALVERGFYCVRMGDPTTKPIAPMDGIIDYAHSPLRSDWLDVFLCARCEFFIGNTSGLLFVPAAFGRPVALANLLPVSASSPFGTRDLGMPKLLWSRAERRMLSFAEILGSDVGNFRFSSLYREHGLEPVENTADEIRDFALEMLGRLDGSVSYSAHDEALQRRFQALLRPGHFSYGSAARVGRDFLRKYEHLIGERPHA